MSRGARVRACIPSRSSRSLLRTRRHRGRAAAAHARDHGLLDADLLGRLRPGALLVNAARGPIVDTGGAPRSCCRPQRISAALDVTDPEPLPAEHPLWDAPGPAAHPPFRRRHARRRASRVRASSASRCAATSAASRWRTSFTDGY